MMDKKYRQGIKNLRNSIEDAQGIDDLNTCEFRIEDNAAQERLFGSTQETQAKRNEIFAALDRLSREQTGENFQYWCNPQPIQYQGSLAKLWHKLSQHSSQQGTSIRNFNAPHYNNTVQPAGPLKIFCLHTPEDIELKKQLHKQFSHSIRLNTIQWQDCELDGGTVRDKALQERLEQADIILLLTSPEFITSEECVELTDKALDRSNQGNACVIPVILQPVDWEQTNFGTLAPLPSNRVPIALWPSIPAACVDIKQGIDKVVKGIGKQQQKVTQSVTLPRPTAPQSRSKVHLVSAFAIIALAVIAFSIYPFHLFPLSGGISTPTPTPVVKPNPTPTQPDLPQGPGTWIYNGETLGVNDGTYDPFDTARPDGHLKIQAAQYLRNGYSSTASAWWTDCLQIDGESNDAEVMIYQENQRVVTSSKIAHTPYITLIVGLNFLKPPAEDVVQRSVLQGAYLAQEEFNNQPQPRNLKLRLLLANTGSKLSYVPFVARQITSIVKRDPTIVGILGWPTSSRTQDMLNALQQAGTILPAASESAVGDDLTKTFPNLFRIVAPNQIQTKVMAWLATKHLGATHAIIFYDIHDNFGGNFFSDLKMHLHEFQPQFVDPQPVNYDIGNTKAEQFADDLKGTLQKLSTKGYNASNTVIILAATFAYDADEFQKALDPKVFPGWNTIAGASGSVANKNVYDHWYVVSSAFHDEWSALMGSNHHFFDNYHSEFDPYNEHPGYYYHIPDNYAIVSYDATQVFLDAVAPSHSGVTNLTANDVLNALRQIKGAQAWQGVSGLISFDADNNPAADNTIRGNNPNNKALIVLEIKLDNHHEGHFQMQCIHGRFSNTPPPPHTVELCPV